MSSLRYAIRTLAHTPAVSLIVIFSLALGIGANTAIFSLFHQALLKRLPVEKPEELVLLSAPGEFKLRGQISINDSAGGPEMIFSYPMMRELEKRPSGLAGVAGYRTFTANLSYEGRTLSGDVNAVTGRYFQVLGVRPLLGRLLDARDDEGKGQPVAVLNHGYWKDRLGGQRDVLNKPIRVNAQVFTIVGVTPEDFRGVAFNDDHDIFVPLAFKPALTPGWDGTSNWNDYYLYAFGRLAPGLTREQSQAALNGVYAGLVEKQVSLMTDQPKEYQERFLQHRLTLLPGDFGHSAFREALRPPLTILLICTALVLLIAAANAANLLLARAVQRTRELSVRTALGASRWRIIRQMLTEAMMLAMGGGVAGLVVGLWALDALVAMTVDADGAVHLFDPRLDPAILGFGLLLAVVTGLLFGIYPALAAARAAVAGTLKEGSGQTSSSRAGVRMRRALVTAQIAVSLLLLIPVGLLLKSLVNLLKTDPGLKTANVITFTVSPYLNGYRPERARQFFAAAEENLAAVPGIEAVSTSMVPLLSGSSWATSIQVEGFANGPDADNNSRLNWVGPGFFSKLGVPLIAGREFSAADTMAAPKVAVVNEAWVNHFSPGRDPVGLRFGIDGGKGERGITVVGVVKNAKYNSLRAVAPRLFHLPYRQVDRVGRLSFYVHSALPEEQTAAQVRRVIAGMDPDLPVESLQTFESRIGDSIRGDRITLQLSSAFALLATVLAMLGLYGVVAFGVARRTREIGIRMAMGANPAVIRGLVFKEVSLILLIGGALGVPGALALGRLARSQLYGVEANDPVVVGGAIAALILAATLAAWLPARRAARINPVEALRYE